jgi:hypothetical protein
MRTATLLFVFVLTIASAAGCSKSASRMNMSDRPHLVNACGFRLKWPGAPQESTQAITDRGGELKHYNALFARRGPEENIIFAASAYELPDKEVRDSNPEERLAASMIALRKDEISRKEIEHGPKKYPGFDILTQSKGLFSRHLVVIAGPRTYMVSVSSRKEALLDSPEVLEFFESFAIDE